MSDSDASPAPGPGVDARGVPVVDPTRNVLDKVEDAIKRLDDLRDAEALRLDSSRMSEALRLDELRKQESAHFREIVALRDQATTERQRFNEELRKAETERINAIRAVDVGAVSRAAEVSAQQAAILAVQVQTSAETLRGQVTAAATATATALATALEPILKRLEELSRVQYEQQGQRTQQTESKSTNQWAIGLIFSVIFLAISIAGFAISLATRH